MKEITIRVEVYDDDMTISDFEQALLVTGIASIDCTYEIIEN